MNYKVYLHSVFILLFFANCTSTRSYDVDYYKDGEFINKENHQKKSFFGYLLMRMRTKPELWPESVALKNSNVIPEKTSDEFKVYYINHATFLIQYKKINILTDPVFAERVSPVSWAGPKRVIKPGVRFKDLPPIDIVIISHDHYDHLETESLKKLYERDKPTILLGLGAGQVLDKGTYKELKWGESYEHPGKNLLITFTPAQHFSGRGLFNRNGTLWGAYLLDFKDTKIYFAGDTGYASHFKNLFNEFGAVDLSLLPVGAYAPRSFMAYQHMDPKEAIQAHLDLRSNASLGMHWGTFQLTNEGREEPKKETLKLAKAMDLDTFKVPENGDCYKMVEKVLKKCYEE